MSLPKLVRRLFARLRVVMTPLASSMEANAFAASASRSLKLRSRLVNTGVLTSLDVGGLLNEEAALVIVGAARQQDKMKFLGLASCKIGPAGAKEIAEYVSVTGVLTKLNVQLNELGDEGEKVLQDAAKGREGFQLDL